MFWIEDVHLVNEIGIYLEKIESVYIFGFFILLKYKLIVKKTNTFVLSYLYDNLIL